LIVSQTIFTACAGLSVGAIVVIVLSTSCETPLSFSKRADLLDLASALDIGQQLQQVSFVFEGLVQGKKAPAAG
jgi:hypothetical protein